MLRAHQLMRGLQQSDEMMTETLRGYNNIRLVDMNYLWPSYNCYLQILLYVRAIWPFHSQKTEDITWLVLLYEHSFVSLCT